MHKVIIDKDSFTYIVDLSPADLEHLTWADTGYSLVAVSSVPSAVSCHHQTDLEYNQQTDLEYKHQTDLK